MFRTKRSRLALSLVSAAAFSTVGSLAVASNAFAHENHGQQPAAPANPVAAPNTPATPSGDITYFVAALNGKNEVPGPAGSPAVGDKDGQAVQILRLKGNQLSFAFKWKGIGAPTAGHIHLGKTGTNGAVKVPFFGAALPGSVNTIVGSVTLTDKSVIDGLKADPTNFYANLHTAEFGGGAVRGQLHKTTKPVDVNSLLRGGPLAGLMDAGQEVDTPGKPTGDPDGHATAFVRAGKTDVKYAFTWNGIGGPTNAHLHEGTVGVNGPIALDLLAAPAGLPASITGVAGSVTGVSADLTKKINQNPSNFYANLHTAEFTGGAVRGQLFRSGNDAAAFDTANFVASVEKGEQIYACTKGEDGKFAFTQHNVSATLQGNVAHSFVKDGPAGPPQWVARDGSSVSGKLISKTPNGADNIAELDLDLTQTGKDSGKFANAVEVLRLNTVGGVAPAGSCDPKSQPIAKVPYGADYFFITK
jgi:hypothetical protein